MAYLDSLLRESKQGKLVKQDRQGKIARAEKEEAAANKREAPAPAAASATTPAPTTTHATTTQEPDTTPTQSTVAMHAQAKEGGGKKTLVASYGDVKIYSSENDSVLLYEIPSPHYRGGEKKLISTLIDIAIGLIPPEANLEATSDELAKKYFKKVLEIIESNPELNVPIHLKEFYANAVVREMVGYGLIDPLTKDDLLEEIMVIGPNKPVYVYHRKYDVMKTNVMFYDDKDIRDLIDRVARGIGRRIDTQTPLLDARLKDGTRVNASIPPATIDGSTLTLRKFKKDPLSVIDLIKFGTLNYEVAALLWLAADGLGVLPANILISGGTASGKTTLLNIFCSFIPTNERIISIEDVAELNLPLEHWVRCEVRPASIEGTGEITMNDLVKNSLRMRPDRIIVGEIRGAEGYTMFTAMNTGHRGCCGTVHANSARETLIRLTNPPINVPNIMLAPLNFIIMENRIHDKRKGTLRRITEFAEVVATDVEKPQMQVLYAWDPLKDNLFNTGASSAYLQMLMKFTGSTREMIQKELDEREAVLRELCNREVRDAAQVCEIIQNYSIKKHAGK